MALFKRLILLFVSTALLQGGFFSVPRRSEAIKEPVSPIVSYQALAAKEILPTATSSVAASKRERPASADPKELAPIFMYHYIEEPSVTTTLKGLYVKPSAFAAQLQALEDGGYQTVFVSEIAAGLKAGKNPPAKSVALTFDDGYEDFYTNAFPLLQKHQAKATVYVIVNALDKPGYLSRAQLEELAKSPLIEIGSHTFNHPDLRRKKQKDADFEIRASRRILSGMTGQPILTFAYPFGYYDQADQAIASSSGYLAAVSVRPDSRQSARDIWLLNRLRPNERTGQDFWRWLKEWLGAKAQF